MRLKGHSGFAASLILAGSAALWQTPVLTRSYDNGRTDASTTETAFTPARAQSKGLRLLKSLKVDDPRIEAQPLYLPQFKLKDGTIHNVVFVVATMGNQVFAFDGDAPAGQDLLWKRSLGKPLTPTAGVQNGGKCDPKPGAPGTHRCTDIDWWVINIQWGILSTPVIDPDSDTLFAVNWVVGPDKKPALFVHRVRLTDGIELGPARPS